MRTLFLTITLFFCLDNYAQQELERPDVFVRIYDLEDKKIGKGKIVSITETAIHLILKKKSVVISISDIGRIKTKKSFGNNLLVGAAVGSSILGVIGAVSSDSDSFVAPSNPGEGLVFGVVLGGVLGAPIGGISGVFRNTKTFEINGNEERLNAFKEIIY